MSNFLSIYVLSCFVFLVSGGDASCSTSTCARAVARDEAGDGSGSLAPTAAPAASTVGTSKALVSGYKRGRSNAAAEGDEASDETVAVPAAFESKRSYHEGAAASMADVFATRVPASLVSILARISDVSRSVTGYLSSPDVASLLASCSAFSAIHIGRDHALKIPYVNVCNPKAADHAHFLLKHNVAFALRGDPVNMLRFLGELRVKVGDLAGRIPLVVQGLSFDYTDYFSENPDEFSGVPDLLESGLIRVNAIRYLKFDECSPLEKKHLEQFKKLKNIHTLGVSGCSSFGEDSLEGGFLSAFPNLHTLNLADVIRGYDDRGNVAALAHALGALPKLATVNLMGIFSGDESKLVFDETANLLATALRERPIPIKNLQLFPRFVSERDHHYSNQLMEANLRPAPVREAIVIPRHDTKTRSFFQKVREKNVNAARTLLADGVNVNALMPYHLKGVSYIHRFMQHVGDTYILHPVALALNGRDSAMLALLLAQPGVDLSHNSIFLTAMTVTNKGILTHLFQRGMPYYDRIEGTTTLSALGATSTNQAQFMVKNFRGEIPYESILDALYFATDKAKHEFMHTLLSAASSRGEPVSHVHLFELYDHIKLRWLDNVMGTEADLESLFVLVDHGLPVHEDALAQLRNLRKTLRVEYAGYKTAGRASTQETTTEKSIGVILESLPRRSAVSIAIPAPLNLYLRF
jgi:hypothetical protein